MKQFIFGKFVIFCCSNVAKLILTLDFGNSTKLPAAGRPCLGEDTEEAKSVDLQR